MKNIPTLTIIAAIAMLALLVTTEPAAGDAWSDSTSNWENSGANYDNSSARQDNNPSNWANSPANFYSDRIIRDSSGNATGYAVPKPDGGVNFFDFDGNRQGYLPR